MPLRHYPAPLSFISRHFMTSLRNRVSCLLLQLLVLSVILTTFMGCTPSTGKSDFQSEWSKEYDRTWVGPDYWANRLQDWRVANGRLECMEGSNEKPIRTVHLLTRCMSTKEGTLGMSVNSGLIHESGQISTEAKTGFLIGSAKQLDYRAAALIHHSYGEGSGFFAGIDGRGNLFIYDFSSNKLLHEKKGTGALVKVKLQVIARLVGKKYALTLSASDPETGSELNSLSLEGIEPDRMVGSLALVSNPGSRNERFWFQDWSVSGSKIERHDERNCGPILSTQYTLSKNIMKMTAQLMPVGNQDAQTVLLETQQDEKWEEKGKAKIIVPGYTATFRIEDWDSSKDVPYRVLYKLKKINGKEKIYNWSGTVRRDPAEKEEIILAAFTGNHNLGHGWRGADSGHFPWASRIWFPHNDLKTHVLAHKPDILFFSGDQVYESVSPTRAQKSPLNKACLDYLYKWYLWCWAFRDMTKDIPAVTIPDDHDVYQGNIWGAGGRKVDKDNRGGYVMPSEFVNMVQQTQTSHLPDPYDPQPIEQGIGVYYCDVNYGRISFAIIEDRKFKSGPAGLAPETKSGRPDHVIDPDFDPRTADVPGAKLLGDRQLKFLEDWASDWEKTDMKAVLSQTVFANATSLHGADRRRLKADYDSNGWPQTGRNKALRKFRKAFAVHISGDQHLATIIHYGIDSWNDAGWSFCVPSIANFYPRSWLPLKPGQNRREGMPDYTGEFLDGLGNYITVWAAANPGKKTGREPSALHDRMPGYGVTRFNKKDRTITFECWPRYADPKDPKTGTQYLGWPKIIPLEDNYARKAKAHLPKINVRGMIDPVMQIIDEATKKIVYTLRIKGVSFCPKVFKEGYYTVKVGEPGTERMKTLYNLRSIPLDREQIVEVKF